MLYEGYHTVPVFNMKVSDKPILMGLAFSVFKVGHKIYIEAFKNITASLLLKQPELVNVEKQKKSGL